MLSHNDAAIVSHDVYNIAMIEPHMCEPLAGAMFMPDYPAEWGADVFMYQNGGSNCMGPPIGPKFAIIEYAEIICPVDTCLLQMPGDADGSGTIDDDDVTYLTDYLHGGGSAPNPLANGDPNGDCKINNGDILYLYNYLNTGGPDPVDCTCVEPDASESACCHDVTGNIDNDPELEILYGVFWGVRCIDGYDGTEKWYFNEK